MWRDSFFFYILLKRSFSDYIRAFFERSEEEGEPLAVDIQLDNK
jgi:hypothetical protein